MRLPKLDYGLLAPFMDGMLDAADDGVMIIDGYESAYGYKTADQFEDARNVVFKWLPEFVKDKDKYRKHTSLGMGFWMDYDWRNKGWDEKDPAKNYFTPEAFENTLKLGLRTADRYVWVYTEKPRWWTDKGGPTGMTQAYIDAVRRAKKSAGR